MKLLESFVESRVDQIADLTGSPALAPEIRDRCRSIRYKTVTIVPLLFLLLPLGLAIEAAWAQWMIEGVLVLVGLYYCYQLLQYLGWLEDRFVQYYVKDVDEWRANKWSRRGTKLAGLSLAALPAAQLVVGLAGRPVSAPVGTGWVCILGLSAFCFLVAFKAMDRIRDKWAAR